MQTAGSQAAFQRLSERIPGGVNSPFRAFSQVGGQPPVLVRGLGPHVWDVDGNRYLDCCCAWGPIMLGHGHPKVVAAATSALQEGVVFGAPTPWEADFADRVRSAFPSIEKVRFVNSGAEAVASALRVARGATRRPRIIKFEGCYHGHVECLDATGLEADAAGGPLVLGASPGAAAEVLIAEFHNLPSLEALLRGHADECAAVLLEPIPGSMGVIVPDREFLHGVRELCDRYGVLLIFDEVLCGFRVRLGGAQELYGVRADLTCLGKALAGGMAVGAYGGTARLMDFVAPLGPVYQAGTFCGNPVTVRSGIACLDELAQPGLYDRLAALTDQLVHGLRALSPDLVVQGLPGMFSIGFGPSPIRSHRDLAGLDASRFAAFFHAMLERGVYLPPSTYDAASLGVSHTSAHVDEFLAAAREAIKETAANSKKT